MIYKPARTFIARYACVLCCLLLIIMSACERVDEFGHPISYSTSPVYDECKRIPLVFPFEITDFYGEVQLHRWDYYASPPREPAETNSPMLLTHILRFAQTNSWFFGERDTGWVYPSGELQYFIFSLSKTNVTSYSDKNEFKRNCAIFGGKFEHMRPFDEQWKAFWEQHGKQKR